MLSVSNSRKKSGNFKSKKSHKKRKTCQRLNENSEKNDERHFSKEEREDNPEIDIDYHTIFKTEPEFITHLKEEIVSCDCSVSQDLMLKNEDVNEGINNSEPIELEEDPLYIKEEQIEVYFDDQETDDDWLNSIQVHTNDDNETCSKCPTCSAIFYEDCKLKAHLFSHSYKEGNQIICSFCNFTTENFNMFVAHIHVHQDQCEACNETVSRRKFFDEHMESAKSIYSFKRDRHKNFVCTVCHLCFQLNHHLRKHWFKHTCQQKRIYQCNTCSALFHTLEFLKNHICLVCPICNKTYSSFPNLRSHTRYEKHLLYCSTCSYEFSLRIDHERHMELHNKVYKSHAKFLYCLQAEDNSTLQCELCGKLMQTDSSFISHVYREHNINVTLTEGSDEEVEIVTPHF